MELHKILLKYQQENNKLKKSADNPFFKSKYLPLDAILDYYIEKFNEDGILCIHSVHNRELTTSLILIEKNETISSSFPLNNTDPQKQWSEITYWKRYNLGALLNIQTDEDDDGNKASSGGNTKQFYKKKPYTKKEFVQLAEAFNSWGRKLALGTYWDQAKDFEITKSIEEKVKKLSEIFKQNQQIDDIDSIWKDAEAVQKEARWF